MLKWGCSFKRIQEGVTGRRLEILVNTIILPAVLNRTVMQKLLILFGLLVTLDAPAQKAPWAGLPVKKTTQIILDPASAEPLTLYLKLDTLRQAEKQQEHDFVSQRWHQYTTVGFGYTDKKGNPYGLWRYYKAGQQGYQLYCEGYYTALQPENLSVDPDIANRFTSAGSEETKRDFLSGLTDRFLHTGEWRFYEGEKLSTILVLGNTVTMPYETVENLSADAKSIASTTLVVAIPQRRLAGALLTAAHMSPDGYLKSIHTEGLNLKFDSKGKPVLENPIDIDQ